MTRTHLAHVCLLTVLTLSGAACGADTPSSLDELPPDLVATWYATSLSFDGRDVADEGMRLKISFASDGTYEVVATRDVIEFVCEGVWDCEDAGVARRHGPAAHGCPVGW